MKGVQSCSKDVRPATPFYFYAATKKKNLVENRPIQWRFLREPSEDIDSAGSVTEGYITWLKTPGNFGGNVHRTKTNTICFLLFSRIKILNGGLGIRREKPGTVETLWKLMDNRRRISNKSKKFRTGKQATDVSEKLNLFRNFIFPVESAEKGLGVFHDPNRNVRFLFWRRQHLSCLRS